LEVVLPLQVLTKKLFWRSGFINLPAMKFRIPSTLRLAHGNFQDAWLFYLYNNTQHFGIGL